jgi:lipid-binding SYLF domain-containing protein
MIINIRRVLRAAGCAAALTIGLIAPSQAMADTAQGQQELVDRATLAVQDVLDSSDSGTARQLLADARAVMICPRVFRASFLFGGEGGGCVLLARGAQGSWSSPAFYSMGGGSFGFQAGIQDAEIIMMIRTDNGLRAVMDNQFRLGADASVALVTVGAGVEGATAVGLNADIVAFAKTRGLFAGISLQGSVMSSDSAGDEVYYGQPVGSVDIVRAMRVNNPGADPLRAALMRFGAPAPRRQTYAAAPAYSAPPEAPVAPGGPAPVQQESLAPPR